MTTYGDALRFIRTCKDSQELRNLNKAVVDQIRGLQRAAATTFEPGNKVQFNISGKRGVNYRANGLWVGIVQHSSGRTVKVLAFKPGVFGFNMMWKVAPDILTTISEAEFKKKEGE